MKSSSAGILYLAVDWFLSALPVDASGRRVFDETLADWRCEISTAGPLPARGSAAIRSLAAVLRSIVLVSMREVRSREGTIVLVRLSAWLGAACLVFLLTNLELLWVTDQEGRSPYGFAGLLLLAVPWLAGFIPPIAFLSGVCTRDSGVTGSRLGPALVVGALMVLVMGWALPAASEVFRQVTFIRSGDVGEVVPGAGIRLNQAVLWVIAVPTLLTLGTIARNLPGWWRLAGSGMPLLVLLVPFVAGLRWPARLYALWAALFTMILLMRLLVVLAKGPKDHVDGALAGAGDRGGDE